MSTHYFDPATREWVSWAELSRRRFERAVRSVSVQVDPEWLQRKEIEETPQEVEVLESAPLRRRALPPPTPDAACRHGLGVVDVCGECWENYQNRLSASPPA